LHIEVFIVLLALVFILFIAAEYLDVVLHVAAFSILFILGLTVMNGNLAYQTGESISQNFTYAASPFNTSINATSTTRNAIYSNFNETWTHWIGYLMMAISVMGFVLVYTHYGKPKKKGPGAQ
jgi:hypothetical protein